MKDKDSFDFPRHSNGVLLLFFISVHCLEKWELKISALFSWKIGRIIFLLFKNVFNMDQYDLGLALRPNNFFDTFEQYLFFKVNIDEFNDWNYWNIAKDWLLLLFLRKCLKVSFFSSIKTGFIFWHNYLTYNVSSENTCG